MKNLKYLALGLIAMLFASCDDKNVEYNYVPQDESKIAKYQLYYVVPCVSGSASNIYESVINGVSYVNNGAALLARYNAIPSGLANIFYTTTPGTNTIQLYQSSKLTKVYDNSCELSTGENTVWVYDFTKAPAVFKETTPPANLQTEDPEVTGAVFKFYNFMYASQSADGTLTPIDYKLQVMLMKEGGKSTNDDDYEPYGEPIAFGECTDWFVKNVKKTVHKSSGYSTQRFGFRKIVNGVDEGWATYTNANGKVTIMRNITITGYFGRAYRRFIYGIADNKTLTVGVSGLVAR